MFFFVDFGNFILSVHWRKGASPVVFFFFFYLIFHSIWNSPTHSNVCCCRHPEGLFGEGTLNRYNSHEGYLRNLDVK